jgi:hypothetical protein
MIDAGSGPICLSKPMMQSSYWRGPFTLFLWRQIAIADRAGRKIDHAPIGLGRAGVWDA